MKILNTIKTFFRMIEIKIWLKTPVGKGYAKEYKEKRTKELKNMIKSKGES